MEKSLTTAGKILAGPSSSRKLFYENLTTTERELLDFCGGDQQLLRAALRGSINERTKLVNQVLAGLTDASGVLVFRRLRRKASA